MPFWKMGSPKVSLPTLMTLANSKKTFTCASTVANQRRLKADEHFALWNILLLGDILVPSTIYSTYFAPWKTLPLKTVCFLEHSYPWNTLLWIFFLALESRIDLGTFMFVCLDFRRSVRGRNAFAFRYVRWIWAVGLSENVLEGVGY